jgi:hypothetical protein
MPCLIQCAGRGSCTQLCAERPSLDGSIGGQVDRDCNGEDVHSVRDVEALLPVPSRPRTGVIWGFGWVVGIPVFLYIITEEITVTRLRHSKTFISVTTIA